MNIQAFQAVFDHTHVQNSGSKGPMIPFICRQRPDRQLLSLPAAPPHSNTLPTGATAQGALIHG
jgi:hypothetical protein